MKTIHVYSNGGPASEAGRYELSAPQDFAILWDQWWHIDAARDGQLSGIMADWIADYSDQFIGKGEALVLLEAWLRKRFDSPCCNEH